jgi:SAM-dependent methyltransferase
MSMSLTRFIKDLLRRAEAIPTPGAIFYNATVAKVLRKPETKIANDIVEKMGNGTILDLGSGTGYLSIEIAKRSPSLQVYGIDLSRQMVKIARRHAQGVGNARFVFGNAAKLPFKDNSIIRQPLGEIAYRRRYHGTSKMDRNHCQCHFYRLCSAIYY